MKNYLLLVSMTIMVCVVVNILVPSPKYSGIIKIVCGLFVVHTLISPIKSIFKTKAFSFEMPALVHDSFESRARFAEKSFEEIITSKREEILSREISAEVKKLWNSSLTVEVKEGKAWVHNSTQKDFEDMKNYLKDRYGLIAVFR